jgi:hypothetical protein
MVEIYFVVGEVGDRFVFRRALLVFRHRLTITAVVEHCIFTWMSRIFWLNNIIVCNTIQFCPIRFRSALLIDNPFGQPVGAAWLAGRVYDDVSDCLASLKKISSSPQQTLRDDNP